MKNKPIPKKIMPGKTGSDVEGLPPRWTGRERTTNQMVCPGCGKSGTHVVDSRPSDAGKSIRRRRVCACGQRFTTYEILSERLAGRDCLVSRAMVAIHAAVEQLREAAVGVADYDAPLPTEATLPNPLPRMEAR